MKHDFIEANGVRFHYVEEGAGPLVLLLHGFPECWYSWRHQLPALADAGFRAIAPDLRGYNLTDKPPSGYNIESLVEDVAALVRAFGEERAHVVGHDWGGVIAWQAAWRRPEIVRSLTVLNAPHPSAFAAYVQGNLRQMLKSSYMLFFQIPRLPELILTRNDAMAIARAFRQSAVRQDAFTEDDLRVYREAFLRPGAARRTLDYYRQAVRQGRGVLPDSPITVPTLVLWGTGDPVLQPEMNDHLDRWVKNLTFKPVPDSGHWLQQEQPGVVNSEIVAWLRAHGESPEARHTRL